MNKVLHIGPLVDEGELHMDRGVKVIEKIAVALKNLRLVVRLRELVVNIKELHRLGVKIAAHTADTVPVHFLIGNTLLDRLRGVRFQPGKKAGLFLRPGRRGSFTSLPFLLRRGSFLPALRFFADVFPAPPAVWFLAICDTSFLDMDL